MPILSLQYRKNNKILQQTLEAIVSSSHTKGNFEKALWWIKKYKNFYFSNT